MVGADGGFFDFVIGVAAAFEGGADLVLVVGFGSHGHHAADSEADHGVDEFGEVFDCGDGAAVL